MRKSSSNGNNSAAPLLEMERGGKRRWWEKMMDYKEGKEQILYSLPLVLTNVCYYLIPLLSVMFAGHLGQLQLAGATLANSWAYVTGFAFMLGLSGALETLCGQGYGAKLYKMMGIYLQASCIITFFFAIIISIIWWFTEPILNSLQQNPEITKQAAIFLRFQIPGIFAFGIIQNILRYLQTQSIVWPTVVCSVVPLLMHFVINYLLVYYTTLGLGGAALATSITFWISVIMLLLYVNYSKDCEHTWTGFSKDAIYYVVGNLKLALPSAAMVCLEYWAFEILVLLAGLFPNSEITTSLIAMCVNTEAIAFNFTYGLSAAASTRVSNELGAGRPSVAKHAMGVTLKISVLLTAIILLALGFGHDAWAGFFSDNTDLMHSFASMTPFVCITIFLDSIQGILSAVCRGCGWQHLVVYINLGTFYFIGMPIACLLAFKFDLYVKAIDRRKLFVAALEGDVGFFEEARNREIENCDEEYFMRQTSSDKYNILHIAIKYRQFEFIQKVFVEGLLPRAVTDKLINQRDNDGNTPLHAAAEEGHIEAFEKLLKYVRGKKEANKETKPLDWSVRNEDGNTPLHVALIKLKFEVAEWLVKQQPELAGSVTNNDGNTPLHVAAEVDAVSFFKVLFIDINLDWQRTWRLRNKKGNTPLHVAIINHNWNGTAKFLLDLFPRLARITNKSKETPLHLALIKYPFLGNYSMSLLSLIS